MKIRKTETKIAGVIFTIMLLLGIGFSATSTLNAQRNGRNCDGYPNWGGSYDLRQTALNAGYNEGVRQGRNDRNRSRGYGYGYGNDFRNSSSYQNATKDYNSRFGDRGLYRRYFRLAFENGYADGLRGY